MKRFFASIVVVAAVAAASCRRQDIRTFTIDVPAMKNAACANLIGNTLTREQSIRPDDIQIDLEAHKVIVKYDSLQRAQKNLVFAIAKAGFEANGVPANPEAVKALPPECK
jgi:copper chaperone CopZ